MGNASEEVAAEVNAEIDKQKGASADTVAAKLAAGVPDPWKGDDPWGKDQPPKRQRDPTGSPRSVPESSLPPSSTGAPPISLEALKAQIIAGTVEALSGTVIEKIHDLQNVVQAHNEANEERHRELEAMASEAVSRVNDVEQQQLRMADEIDQLRKRLLMAERHEISDLDRVGDAWDRALDPTIFLFGCDHMVPQAAVGNALAPLLAECNIEQRHVAIRGNAGGRRACFASFAC